jgi:hypothetical protein
MMVNPDLPLIDVDSMPLIMVSMLRSLGLQPPLRVPVCVQVTLETVQPRLQPDAACSGTTRVIASDYISYLGDRCTICSKRSTPAKPAGTWHKVL